jgi:DNA-binding ferritin-like protein
MEKTIILLVQLQTVIKLFHWSSKSYSEHIALGELYDSLSESIDTLVESVQGETGILDIKIPQVSKEGLNPITTITNVCKQLELVKKEDWITNQIQEILKDLYKTKYKLINLK